MANAGILAAVAGLAAAALLGLLAGALLAEGALLVPYWRTLPPEQFYALHPTWGPRLYRFYAPLTIATPLAALLSALVAGVVGVGGGRLLAACAAALLALALVACYGLYFRRANDEFARCAVPPGELAAALARWAAWHRARVVIAILAFACSLLAL
ncbi:hypothetical protein GCM10028796_09170 [Ramlibacter monticola]|uniref:DUF1772 domain-containing protein n=1 Tax=Ramlibacter monticola TaxID=1926872 RepID=A0A937CP99_9BURK|nr:DUF1772 domain-containing protein [Ramlibacter monticola]MBL0389775.1 DUF1772 domain-containing protein [Ramlibacter monticola]